jgi:outer membrane protein assembly factor BamA
VDTPKSLRIALILLAAFTILLSDNGLVLAQEIASVSFEGKYRVREWILRNEIELHKGDRFDPDTWELDRKRLASLAVFSEVLSDTSSSEDGIHIEYTLKEVWTFIPLISIGGEINNIDIDIGFIEKDLFGIYMEAGFLYSHFEDRNSYSSWLNWPRAFGTKYSAGIAGCRQHSREPAESSDEQYRYHYDVERNGASVSLGKRLAEKLVVGCNISYLEEQYELEPALIPPVTLPQRREQRVIRPSGYITLGRVYYDDFFFDGRDLFVRGDLIAFDIDDYEFKYWMTSIQARNYIDIGGKWNICNRIVFGTSRIRDVLPTFAVSGLSAIRGVEDRVRRGSKIYYGNNELRFRVFRNRWLHSQLTAFADFGNAWEEQRSFREVIETSMLTYGAGVRIGLVRFYNAIGRADIAFNTSDGSLTLYFSAGQFF